MQPGLNFRGTTPILKGLNNTEKMLIFTRDEIRVSTVGQEHEITLVLKAQCIDIYKSFGSRGFFVKIVKQENEIDP